MYALKLKIYFSNSELDEVLGSFKFSETISSFSCNGIIKRSEENKMVLISACLHSFSHLKYALYFQRTSKEEQKWYDC